VDADLRTGAEAPRRGSHRAALLLALVCAALAGPGAGLAAGAATSPAPLAGAPSAEPSPAVAARDAAAEDWRRQALQVAGEEGQALRITRGGGGPPLDEVDLALAAGQEELAEELRSRIRAVKLRWVAAGALTAAAGVAVLSYAVLQDAPPLPEEPYCLEGPCAAAWDTDIWDARYRQGVKDRERFNTWQASLALGGGVVALGGAVLVAIATQVTGAPHLSHDRSRELVSLHNEALARRLGLDAAAPSSAAGAPPEPGAAPEAPGPAAPPAGAPPAVPSESPEPAGPQWLLGPMPDAAGLRLTLLF